jgi:hypothetical protein
MVNVVGNNLRNAHIMLKTGIDAFSGAVSGNMESKKRLTQQALHTNMEKVRLEEVWKYDRNRSGETTGQLFNTST